MLRIPRVRRAVAVVQPAVACLQILGLCPKLGAVDEGLCAAASLAALLAQGCKTFSLVVHRVTVWEDPLPRWLGRLRP